jgi:hypothetical protein
MELFQIQKRNWNQETTHFFGKQNFSRRKKTFLEIASREKPQLYPTVKKKTTSQNPKQ